MHEEEKAVVRCWLQYMQGDQDEASSGFETLTAPDVERLVPGRSAMSGTHKGREALEDFSARMWETGDGRGGRGQRLNREFGFELTVAEIVALEPSMKAAQTSGELARPEQVADAVVWLCSDAASFVNGEAMLVDGGVLCR